MSKYEKLLISVIIRHNLCCSIWCCSCGVALSICDVIEIVEINFIWVEGNIKSNYCYIIINTVIESYLCR